MTERVEVNGRRYAIAARPTVVVCVDGFDPAYLQQGLRDGVMPTLARFVTDGFAATALSVVPSFTNPNNTSIITGVAPSVHGISGNCYLDRESGREVMVTDAHPLRCDTILAALSRAGVRVAAITAKDKLRKILAKDLHGIAFSSQCADQVTAAENGIENVEAAVGRPAPDPYSADLSLFVLDAGLCLLERNQADLFYLSLSDFVQHAHGPGAPEADAFHRAVDDRLARLVALGAVVGVVADHGMRDKSKPDGSPNVIFLEDWLNERFGAGAFRVVCPIADPFVRHHGALGGYVRIYIQQTGVSLASAMEAVARLAGVDLVLTGQEAAGRFDLPAEFEGDFVVISGGDTAIGASRARHDLSGLEGHRFRSHGGLAEQPVPFLVSRPLTRDYARRAVATELRNFDIFDYILNGVQL